MLRGGYINYIPRVVFGLDFWVEKPFDRGHAFIDLWQLASIKDGTMRNPRGVRYKVLRGQVGHSIKYLAERWGWSDTKVKLFLKELQEDSQIVSQKNNVTTIITILNYDNPDTEVPQKSSQKSRKKLAEVSQGPTIEVRLNEGEEADEAEGGPQPPLIETMNVTTPELALLRLVPGYPFDATLDLEKLTELGAEFPEVDIPELLKGWALYITDRKKRTGVAFKANASPRSQLRNQFKMAKDKGMHKRGNGNGSGALAHDEADYEKYVDELVPEEDQV